MVVTETVSFRCPEGHVEASVTTRAGEYPPAEALDPLRSRPPEKVAAITPEDVLEGKGECPECGADYVYEWGDSR